MEDDHRNIIKNNLDGLIAKTEFKKLIDLSVKHHILSINMKNILMSFSDDHERHKQLFIKITKRGPTAYSALRNICKIEFPDADKILCPDDAFTSIREKKRLNSYRDVEQREPVTPMRTKDVVDKFQYDDNKLEEDNPSELEIYSRPTYHDPSIVVQKSDKIHFNKTISTYSMRSKHRGVFLMVNIINFPFSTSEPRNGAYIDRENLIYLFREFGFDVFYYEDLTLAQFRTILVQLLNSEYTLRTECFVMALMTHGTMNNGKERIEFHDSAYIFLSEIIEYFSNPLCKNLVGKPKIFLFPFCRGEISDQGTYGNNSVRIYAETDGISNISKPTISDITILYATVPGYRTHRDPDTGSWYVQIMCEIWSKQAHDTDFETLEKLVGEKTGKIRADGGKLQTSSKVAHGFYKALYFNPGYYEN